MCEEKRDIVAEKLRREIDEFNEQKRRQVAVAKDLPEGAVGQPPQPTQQRGSIEKGLQEVMQEIYHTRSHVLYLLEEVLGEEMPKQEVREEYPDENVERRLQDMFAELTEINEALGIIRKKVREKLGGMYL